MSEKVPGKWEENGSLTWEFLNEKEALLGWVEREGQRCHCEILREGRVDEGQEKTQIYPQRPDKVQCRIRGACSIPGLLSRCLCELANHQG